jgi:putative acetyltransferase
MGSAVTVVLGQADYYPRFGFTPASRHGLACQWDGVPDEAFMVRFLRSELDGVIRGTVRYLTEFNAATENTGHESDQPA